MRLQKFTKLLNPYQFSTINKRFRWTSEASEYFANLFDMPQSTAQIYRTSKKIPVCTKEQLELKATLFKTIGIPTSEWLKYPIFFKETTTILEQRYLQLREGGFSHITAEILADYKQSKQKEIRHLKRRGYIDQNLNVAESFISYLNPTQKNFFISDISDDNIFDDVHHKILSRYLVWRLNTTEDNIIKLFRVTNSNIMKSFKDISTNLNLLEIIGFTNEAILKNGYLLKKHPAHLQAVLSEIPQLAGVDIATVLRVYPKIIGRPPEHYLKIYKTLSDAGISDKCIQRDMHIFLMNPKGVQHRIDQILSVPELKVFLNSPVIVRFIRCYNEARSRLSFLQEIKFRCARPHILSNQLVSNFNANIREGKDVTTVKEVVALLQNLLDSKSKNLIEGNIRRHPYCTYVPVLDIQESYRCLKKQLKFPNESIIDAVQIVLYPSKKIMDAHKMIQQSPDLKDRVKNPTQTLNLMLYFIEKEHHFTGNAIWRDDVDM